MKITAAGSILALAALAALPAALPDSSSLESIRVDEIRSELYYLASDEMQGRQLGSPSNDVVSRYIANHFEGLGLVPAGSQGYFQEFGVVQGRLSKPNRLEFQARGSSYRAALEEDFFPSPLSASGRAKGPVVFAGYGITAPDIGYDDYLGLDVKGKVALVLDHEPGEDNPRSVFDGVVLSDYGRDLHKILNAQRRGAVGVIIAEDEANHGPAGSFAREARATWPEDAPARRWQLKAWTDQVRIPAVFLSAAKANLLLPADRSAKDLQKAIDRSLKPRGFDLPRSQAELRTSVQRQESPVRNVLAALRGSDPALAQEWIVVGAHFDHVGVEGDEVFNGADDDASGTVGLLEIAEAFAAGRPPRRSVLFAAWNAEESGLLGSYYFVDHPTVPLAQTAAVFQMDMIGRDEEVPDPDHFRFRGLQVQTAEQNRNALNILGYSKSPDLEQLASRANRYVELELHFRYDNQELGLLRRSDQWPFLTRGIPALFFHTGLHPDYHRPSDTADKINYEKMAKVIRLVFLSSWEAANDDARPAFKLERIAR